MALYKIDFSVATNEDWYDSLALVENAGSPDPDPYDLTGSSFRMQVRTKEPRLAVVLELSTANGRLVIEPAPEDVGKLTVLVDQAVIANIGPGDFYHDIVWTMADGRDVNLAKGALKIELGITR